MKILAIDDNQDNLISLKALIFEAFPNIVTLTALNGKAGLELAAKEDPDVILLDVVMPGMDGFEVCQKLKEDENLWDIPVVFVTALKGDKESRIRALECGAEAFLAKPIDESELTAQIRAMVKIKNANISKRDEKARLAAKLKEQSHELEEKHRETLNLLDDLKHQVESRKKSEERLRESDEKFRQLANEQRIILNNSSVGISHLKDRKVQWGNPAFDKIFGYEAGTTQNLDTAEFYASKESYEQIGDEAYVILGNDGSYSKDVMMKKKDGSFIWCNLAGQAISLGNTKDGSIWVIQDISERKRAEEVVQQRLIALTQPLDSGEITFEELFNINDVQRLQNEFAKATGVASIITNPDGTPVTTPSNFTRLCNDIVRVSEKGCANCIKSDAVLGRYNPDGPNIQTCLSGGLWDAGAGISVGGHHIANWLIGQVRDETQTEDSMRVYAREIGVDEATFIDAFLEVPPMSQVHFGQIAQYLFTLANQLSATAYQNIQQARFINERKQQETYKDISREILQRLNEQGDLNDIIQQVITLLKKRTGFDAVGIRLQEGEDYPYMSEEGFPKELLLKENSLVERTDDGGVRRDKDGNVSLECTCGLVITGKIEQPHPLFTLGGSFWTNDSFPLLEIPPESEPRHKPRNGCIHHNYASVALVPIRNKDKIVGLLQFNDRRKDQFTLASVELLENIAMNIGSAIMRKLAEKEKESLESQLHQSQKMESVGRLAGGVAHDFNNMLTVINGYSNLGIMEADKNSTFSTYFKEILKTAERSAGLTHQLLAFARKQTVSPKVVDLNKTLTEMLKMLQRLIGEDIDLGLQLATRLWPVKLDPSQIDQILANLCVNARDSIAGVGKISIETENTTIDMSFCARQIDAIPGEYVCLRVIDNGSGMNQETMLHIFEPFFTTKGIGEGTGLGLATVFGIVKQNSGFLTVDSEQGIGTTFNLFFPRHNGVADQLAIESSNVPLPQGFETILMVEDEQAILDMSSIILKRQGYNVLTANCPSEAIRISQEHAGKIHLILSDVIMPEMNGRDLVENLQSLSPDMKSIFMSGYTADVIGNHGLLKEGVHFIQKPYTFPNLVTKVRAVLDSA